MANPMTVARTTEMPNPLKYDRSLNNRLVSFFMTKSAERKACWSYHKSFDKSTLN